MNQVIRCKNCDEIFMKTPYDQSPEYEVDSNLSPENIRSIERDDFQDFLIHHQGHQLENLKIIEDSFVSEGPYFEPVKTSFLKATNGKENFVIKKFREKIDEPLKYQLVFGDYTLQPMDIDIQSDEISKQLYRELKPPLSPSQISAFLKLYRTLAQNIDLQNCERVPEESPHPLEVYYKMDDVSLMYLLRNCHHLFKGQEYSAMEEFIHRHKDDGVLLLKATFKIQITEIAKPEKKVIPTSLSVKKEKVIEKK